MNAGAERLKDILSDMGSAVVAFSGGVDSAFLLKAALDAMEGEVLAVTAVSPSRCEDDAARAKRTASDLGARHLIIETHELELEPVRYNRRDRCYHCKRALFTDLTRIAREKDISYVAEGSNADDVNVLRPGMAAVREFGGRSPLLEAGLGKSDIRRLSRRAGLDTWDAPSQSCCLTRFPYDRIIEARSLARLKKAESLLVSMGFREVRVRVDADAARIEVSPGQVSRLSEEAVRGKVADVLRELGYTRIEVDPAGYRSGSMDPAGGGTE